ncbi:DinB [Rhodoferax ferrireducens T118]|uniref:DinB n=1 Tax=Albidiferax ferrireducens (strain ATCC BAA-621 / DSM 15236 / T118) TaxID=338969 RepID=Q222Y9_ALBFT|nr:DinB family protein [Rhodoferax ferrireducens]ABD67914.1 DinB [Rhodoferax ferrireducens T118]
MSQKILSSLFAQKSWANRELFDVLASMTSTDQAASLHTAIRTLNHIYVVDRIFRAHLAGEKHPYTATNTPETPALGELHIAVAETDLWFEDYASKITGQALAESLSFQFTDGDSGSMTREEMLFHVLTHGSYHRGNVGQILKGISVAPPRDLYTKFLHVHEPARREAE